MTSRRVRAPAALAVFGVLAGCGDPPPEETQAPKTAPKPAPATKTAELGSQMVSAVSAGKTAAAISVHFALGESPSVGKPLPVQIAIVAHQNFSSVSAHFECHDGLDLSMGGDFGPVADVAPEKSLSHQLMLVPTKEGMFMVTVSVDTIADDENVVRIFSIPVIVGPAQTAAPAPPK